MTVRVLVTDSTSPTGFNVYPPLGDRPMTTHDITAPGDKERTLLDSETGERTTLPLYDTDHRRKVQVHLTLTLAEGWRRELLMAGGDPASDNATLVADALMRGLTGPWSLYAIDVAVDGR